MDKFKIRIAQKNDAYIISILLEQLGYNTAPSTLENLVSITNDDHIYVGVLNGKVIAVMSLIFFNYFPSAEKLCRITSIVVDEKVRGSGIGSKLINHAKEIAVIKKCDVLEITTSLNRTQTQAYYENIGFKKTSYKYIQKLNTNI